VNRIARVALVGVAVVATAACSPQPDPAPGETTQPSGRTDVTVTVMATVDGYQIRWFCDGRDKIILFDQHWGVAAMANHPDCPAKSLGPLPK
jgi:hypothetical protein